MVGSSVRKLVLVLAAVVVAVAGCSSDSNKSSAATSGTTATTASAAPASTSAASVTTTAASTGLSGKWSGTYDQTSGPGGGGTFDIDWQQSGSNVTGKIDIPGVCANCPITATLSGDTVKFGVVSGITINYTGTVSGDSMSGTYESVDGTYKGSWKASRSG